MIVEKGIFLGTKYTKTQVINLYRVDSIYAVMYYSLKNRIVTKIDWERELSADQYMSMIFPNSPEKRLEG
jgi:hypothetical protein